MDRLVFIMARETKMEVRTRSGSLALQKIALYIAFVMDQTKLHWTKSCRIGQRHHINHGKQWSSTSIPRVVALYQRLRLFSITTVYVLRIRVSQCYMKDKNKRITRFCDYQTKVSWYRISSWSSVAELKRNTHIIKRETRKLGSYLQYC